MVCKVPWHHTPVTSSALSYIINKKRHQIANASYRKRKNGDNTQHTSAWEVGGGEGGGGAGANLLSCKKFRKLLYRAAWKEEEE